MTQKTEVLYNGECPICSREVNHYARLSEKQALPIRYDDLTQSGKLADWGVTADQAAKRFHVRKDGEVISGIPAFVVLWRDIPQTRWLARIIGLPGVHWAACKLYDYILAPLLYAFHKRRQRRINP
ncbi:thiol-disulfide oxidoreductase DCC family protein [uncultured Sulfitobacter sp.]|uniref:thiol-disulfide oxidoreductase DCC family protein n=1 Tax=uncultured Sulfitobacter sp. TaxID=191468 RepID=UPI002609248F|nr:DUF393 domain-containing protein [uncultured Sulfitobacter sp.]